jgi:hypothetical protein
MGRVPNTWVLMGALLMLSARTAGAQDRPQTIPSRDVDIFYTMTRSGQTLQEHTRWRAEAQEERVDPPGRDLHFIMDHRQHRAWLVNDARHTVMEMAAPRDAPADPASFARQSDAIIAGRTCTDWATSGAGPQTVLCLTTDGVLLRVQANGHTLIEATEVNYAPADPALFTIPSTYTHTAPPT